MDYDYVTKGPFVVFGIIQVILSLLLFAYAHQIKDYVYETNSLQNQFNAEQLKFNAQTLEYNNLTK